MPKIPPEKITTLRQTTTVRQPIDFTFKEIAQQLGMSQGKLIRNAVREYAQSRGIVI